MMREQARVTATQHQYWKTHGGQFKARNPVSFEKWVIIGIRRAEKKGIEFEFLCSGLIQIRAPGKPNMLRTLQYLENIKMNISLTSNHFCHAL